MVGFCIDLVFVWSWLLVNGVYGDWFEFVVYLCVDIVVFDIEDVVVFKDKYVVWDNVVCWFGDGNVDWVCINGFGIFWWVDDLVMLVDSFVGGVMLVMVELVDYVIEIVK